MFSNQTYEIIKQRILGNTDLNIDKREGSFLNNQISPIAEELAKAYINMGDILSLAFIEENFDTYLETRVSEFGVYRKEGIKATGEIIVEGQEGAIIENGTVVKSGDLYFTVLNDIELPDDNIIYVEANEVGYEYNVLENTEFELAEKDDKITRLYSSTAFKNGVDIETDEELRERFKKVVNNPSTSGNKYHYEQWALEVPGVGRCIVYPLWDKSNGKNGAGTVKVMVIGNDNKPVSEDIVQSATSHISEKMPIGCKLTVTTPTLLSVTIRASVEIKRDYAIEEVKEEFNYVLGEYLKTTTTELTYSKIYGLLANLPSVEDISNLTLNGGSSNISIAEDKLVDISSVDISEVV